MSKKRISKTKSTTNKSSQMSLESLTNRTSWLLVLVLVALLFIITAFLIRQQNSVRAGLLEEQAVLQRALDEQESLSTEIDQIEANENEAEAIERVAREELGMIKEDEIIFINQE